MENISIKARLIGLVLILIGMVAGIGIFGMISTHDIIAHLEEDAHKEQKLAHTLELAERTEIEFKSQVIEFKNILLRGNNPEYFDNHYDKFKGYSKIVDKDLDKLVDKYDSLGMNTDEIEKVRDAHDAFDNNVITVLKRFDINDPDSGKKVDKLSKGIYTPAIDAAESMIHHLSEEIDNVIKASEEYAMEVEASTKQADIAIISIASILGLVLGTILIRSIVQPLNQIIAATQRLAQGDMTGNIDVVGKNEISKLQASMSEMSNKLRSVVSEVQNSATSVSLSAGEISTGSLDLSSRTEEQAASIEETSVSMEQVTERVHDNSTSATEALQLATNAASKAEHGLTVAQSAVNAITEIRNSSEKVADIIGVIDEIAFQTNLLALNASIEAERAGEQGRGFSVVANEVQKLAQRSADAASEIKELIKSSTNKVQEGTELVKDSSKALEEIVQSSHETNALVSQISDASQEQAQALTQVNAAIVQLEETTQQNAAMVEETSAASTSMDEQAKVLADIVSFFKLNSHQVHSEPAAEIVSPVTSSTVGQQVSADAEWKAF